MIWIVVVVFVFASGYLLFRRLARPLLKVGITRNRFAQFATDLLAQGAHDTRLVMQPQGYETELQIAKTIEPNGERRLQLLFPDAPWSREQYPKVKQALSKHRIPYTDRPWHEPPVQRLLFVLHVNGSEDAARIAHVIFDAMGLSPDHLFTLRYEGGASLAEWKRHVDGLNT